MFEREPAVTPALLEMRNVVLTPHLGSAVVETRDALANAVADNILALIEGRRPPNIYNPEVFDSWLARRARGEGEVFAVGKRRAQLRAMRAAPAVLGRLTITLGRKRETMQAHHFAQGPWNVGYERRVDLAALRSKADRQGGRAEARCGT